MIQSIAEEVDRTIKGIDEAHKPNSTEVGFGLKFNGDLDVIIAKAGVEASINVTLRWENHGT